MSILQMIPHCRYSFYIFANSRHEERKSLTIFCISNWLIFVYSDRTSSRYQVISWYVRVITFPTILLKHGSFFSLFSLPSLLLLGSLVSLCSLVFFVKWILSPGTWTQPMALRVEVPCGTASQGPWRHYSRPLFSLGCSDQNELYQIISLAVKVPQVH